jgi:hypothetical protein
MSALDMEATPSVMSWPEICRQYPDEWVMLIDVEHEPNGNFRCGRLFAHDRSAGKLLGDPRELPPRATLVHTWALELGLPFRRVEVLGDPIEHESVEIVLEGE